MDSVGMWEHILYYSFTIIHIIVQLFAKNQTETRIQSNMKHDQAET